MNEHKIIRIYWIGDFKRGYPINVCQCGEKTINRDCPLATTG